MRNYINEHGKTIVKGLVFTLLVGSEFLLVECYEHNPFAEVRVEAAWFNVLLLELLTWFLFVVIGRARIALWIETILVMIFGLTNHYVMEFRSTPFVPWDLLSLKTAASVADEYQFTFPKEVILVTLGFLAILVIAFFLDIRIKAPLWKRLIPGFALGLCIFGFVNCLQDEDFQTDHYLYPFLFTPAYMTKVNGMLVTFTMNLSYIVIDRPAGYDASQVEATLAAYQTEEEVEIEDLPNVIVIMDEAFSDLGVLASFETNQDYMPFVHSLEEGAENTITGHLNVSVCGGNTANTEFEFLTGNTMAFLPGGSIPYQQYIKEEKQSLASYLADLGYETYAFHPYYAAGWNRNEVYPYLGFESTIFIENMAEYKKLRNYISDETDFDTIIKTYESKEADTPMFFFNVTMQNHGSYSDAYDNFEPDTYEEGSQSFALAQYLSLVRVTDQELEKLIDYFREVDEKTVIVFFGDHQPNDYIANCMLYPEGKTVDSDYSGDNQYLRYQVPYVIWANYDIDEATNVDTSANFLAAEVLKAAGIPTNEYMNYLLELKETYTAITSVRVERADNQETTAKEEKENLLTYQQLQYYYLFD